MGFPAAPIATALAVGGSGGATTVAVDTTGANFITATVSGSGAVAAATLTDSYNNTWTPCTEQRPPGSTPRCQHYYCLNPTVGALHTFTCALASSFSSVCATAWPGAIASGVFDVENGATTTAGTTVQTGSVTPGENNALVIAGMGTNATGTDSIDSGFTIATQLAFVSGAKEGLAQAYLIQTAAAAVNPTWTKTGAAANLAGVIAVFKPIVATSSSGSGWVTVKRLRERRRRLLLRDLLYVRSRIRGH